MRGSKSIGVAALSKRRNATVRNRRYRRSQLTFFARARGLGAAIALGEFFHATGGVDEFLFAGKKRMASSANADSNVAPGRARMINRAARPDDIGLVIFLVNACFNSSKLAPNVTAQ